MCKYSYKFEYVNVVVYIADQAYRTRSELWYVNVIFEVAKFTRLCQVPLYREGADHGYGGISKLKYNYILASAIKGNIYN